MSPMLPSVEAPKRTKRRFGMPFQGYTSSVASHLCPLDKAHGGPVAGSDRSSNMLFDPQEGKFYRRPGIAVVGGTSGILENGTGELTVARARQMISLLSTSFASGYPTHSVLYTEESNVKGCVYIRNHNGLGFNYVIGSEFSTTHYPVAANTPSYFKVLPYLRTTDGTLGRLNSIALRAMQAVGSRRMLEVGDRLYLPNKDGTPACYNLSVNDDTGDTGDILRFWHTGSPSPLGMVNADTGTVNANGVWQSGDVFFYSVAYKFADGSVSMPIIPRDANDDVNYDTTGAGGLMTYFGKVTVDADCNYLTVTQIPIGPDGPNPCVGRFLLRSPKANVSTDPYPSIFDLRITAYLPNNTQTTYQDPNGNDGALVTDPLIVRFDHIMQPPARYIGSFDNRVLVGYTKPNPVAIYLCPNLNVSDNAATIDDTIYEYNLSGGILTLYKIGQGTTTITADNTVTIQYVVDKINNTTDNLTTNGGKWWACVAPGADPTALCSTSAAANNNLTSTTGCDVGDATAGRIRSFGSSYYAPIFYSTTYLANYPTEKRRLFFTMGGPGMPTFAAHSWAAGNIRTAPRAWGEYMGNGALRSGAVVCFSKAIGTLENRKAGVSGEDIDYRLYELNPARGCIAWDSIVEFNGAVGYLTADGYVITDGREEIIISGDVWNPATRLGEWAYEITQSQAGAAADTDLSHFHAKAMSGKLYITYRLAGAVSYPDRMIVYDFSGSAQYAGLRGLLRPDGSTWGWSTPLSMNLSVLGEVRNASGSVRYGTKEDNAGANSNGRIEQFDGSATDDNGSVIAASCYGASDFAETTQKKSAQEMSVLYKGNSSGMKVDLRADDGSAFTSLLSSGVALTTTGASGRFKSLKAPLPNAARCQVVAHQPRVTDDGSGSAMEFWGLELQSIITAGYV